MAWAAELGLHYDAKHKAQMTEIQSNPQSTDRLTRGHNPFYQAGFASAGGGQCFDPQIASAIRGKVRVVRLDPIFTAFTLNPWSGTAVMFNPKEMTIDKPVPGNSKSTFHWILEVRVDRIEMR